MPRRRGADLTQVATASEPTVQRVARGETPPPPKRRRSPASSPKVVEEWTARPSDSLWQRAQDVVLARGVPRNCVQVISASEVIVWNHPAPWPKIDPPA